jgi:Mg-chelatase subunit ChlD
VGPSVCHGAGARSGKTDRPVIDGGAGLIKRGDEAEAAINEASRRTSSRRELSRHQQFEQVSPEVGHLDEKAFDEAMSDDEDSAMAMLADLTGATDPLLRELARRLAGRVVVDVARRGAARRRGIGRLARRPLQHEGDIDLDASIEAIAEARAVGGVPAAADLRVRTWVRPDTALCLVVDRSGSMGGERLATAAVAAATVAWRTPSDYSVLAFAADVLVLKEQLATTAAERVADGLFRLRGFGTTDVALALRAAGQQLALSRAARRITVLLSDCRPTAAGDMLEAARGLDELVIVAPDDDREEADAFGRAVGAIVGGVAGPSTVAETLATLLA